jgi:stress response protein YsnF
VPIKREEVRLEQEPGGEMRIRKEDVEDEETVEVDFQREQVDLDGGGGEEDVRR